MAMDGLRLLDLAGPAEVLSTANLLSGQSLYRALLATLEGADVRADSGVRVGGDLSLA